MIRSLDNFQPKSCPLSLSVELREKDGMPMVEICDLSKNEFNPAWPYESLHVASVPLPDIADLYSEIADGLRLDELSDALPEGYAPYLEKKDVAKIREWVIDMRDKYADAILHCAAASHNKETLLKAANERCEEAWESIRETIEGGGYNPYDIEDLARRGSPSPTSPGPSNFPRGSRAVSTSSRSWRRSERMPMRCWTMVSPMWSSGTSPSTDRCRPRPSSIT